MKEFCRQFPLNPSFSTRVAGMSKSSRKSVPSPFLDVYHTHTCCWLLEKSFP